MEYNRLLAYRQTKRNWDIHEEKIKTIKPTINTRTTSSAPKQKLTNRKYGQLNRLLDVQFQNKALLKKLTQCKFKSNVSPNPAPPKISKNKYVLKELQREIENKGLLKRIQNSKTSYKATGYIRNHKQNEKYANIFSKYSYKGQKPNKTIIKFEMVNDVGKYVDSNRNNHSPASKTSALKPLSLNKIVNIHEQRSFKISSVQFMVRAIQRETNIILQIRHQDVFFSIQLCREEFEKKYEGSIDKILKKIKYDIKQEQLYLS